MRSHHAKDSPINKQIGINQIRKYPMTKCDRCANAYDNCKRVGKGCEDDFVPDNYSSPNHGEVVSSPNIIRK